MMKKLTGIAVLGAVLGGVMAAAASKPRVEDAQVEQVEQVIDARLHELLVQLNAKR